MSDETSNLSRRGFVKALQGLLAATGMTAIIGPLVAYFWPANLEEVPSEPVPAGPANSIPLGEAKTIRFGRYPALIINTPEGFKTYSAVCTHFACIVKWDPETEQIVCPCHEGFFEPINGEVITGPPPTPLEKIPHFIEDGNLFVGGEA